jgi:hypothetical protein
MAETQKPAGGKRIIDVAHPDESAPADNSKSVIISHRPILQDPMMRSEGEPIVTDSIADKQPPVAKTIRKSAPKTLTAPLPKLELPTDTIAAEAESIKTKADAKSAAATAEPAPETDADNSDDPTPAVDVEQQAQQQEADSQAAAKHQALIDKLSESKKYYLPIDTIENRRSRRFVVLGILLSLLLIVAWADIALDAGLIQLGSIKPVTHFFSN